MLLEVYDADDQTADIRSPFEVRSGHMAGDARRGKHRAFPTGGPHGGLLAGYRPGCLTGRCRVAGGWWLGRWWLVTTIWAAQSSGFRVRQLGEMSWIQHRAPSHVGRTINDMTGAIADLPGSPTTERSGRCRTTWLHALAHVGQGSQRLTSSQSWSGYSLNGERNDSREDAAPWWPEVSMHALRSSKRGVRNGPTRRVPPVQVSGSL